MVVDYPIEKKMTKGLFLTFKSNDEMREHLVKTFPDDLPLGYVNSWFPAYYTAFRPRDMSAFLDRFVRPKKKMFIGSVPKDEVEQLFGYIDYYISTPRKNAFAEIDNWWQEVEKHIDEVELVLPAVGISTRVITKRLWEQGSEIHCLDLGSIVDAISSYPNTRSWIRLKGHVASRILLPEYRNNSARYWIRYGLKEIYLFFRSLFYRIDPFASLPFFPKARVYHPGPRKTYR